MKQTPGFVFLESVAEHEKLLATHCRTVFTGTELYRALREPEDVHASRYHLPWGYQRGMLFGKLLEPALQTQLGKALGSRLDPHCAFRKIISANVRIETCADGFLPADTLALEPFHEEQLLVEIKVRMQGRLHPDMPYNDYVQAQCNLEAYHLEHLVYLEWCAQGFLLRLVQRNRLTWSAINTLLKPSLGASERAESQKGISRLLARSRREDSVIIAHYDGVLALGQHNAALLPRYDYKQLLWERVVPLINKD